MQYLRIVFWKVTFNEVYGPRCKAQEAESKRTYYVCKRVRPKCNEADWFINELKRSSEKEHKADALALGADEGRDKLR